MIWPARDHQWQHALGRPFTAHEFTSLVASTLAVVHTPEHWPGLTEHFEMSSAKLCGRGCMLWEASLASSLAIQNTPPTCSQFSVTPCCLFCSIQAVVVTMAQCTDISVNYITVDKAKMQIYFVSQSTRNLCCARLFGKLFRVSLPLGLHCHLAFSCECAGSER